MGVVVQRWRIGSLIAVHLAIAVHIGHWLWTGYSVAPLEVSEALYTLHRGVVTAGFVLMALAMAATAVFGRFFCGWGCHLLALQDLCAGALGKFNIKPRLLRSRALQWAPLLAAVYLFVWPVLWRLGAGVPQPSLHVGTDAEGWGGFMTDDLWRSFGAWPITVSTLLICGLGVVYLLGSRAFCRYACPYGAVFGVADRFSPGRIQLTGDCQGCGKCTAACGSGVTVHLEVKQFQMVTDGRCLKCFDCVDACPVNVLSYGFGVPALHVGPATRRRYDLSNPEEVGVSLVFLGAFLTFRGLYEIPFLMALGVGLVVAYAGLKSWRMSWSAPRLAHVAVAGLALFMVHSAVVRYHEFRAQWAFVALPAGEVDRSDPGVSEALRRLELVESYALMVTPAVRRRLASLYLAVGDAHLAQAQLQQVLVRAPDDAEARLNLGLALHRLGRDDEARSAYEAVVGDPRADEVHRAAAQVALAAGEVSERRFVSAERRLREAVAWDPTSAQARSNLGVVFHHTGRFEEAGEALRGAAQLAPADVEILTNLAAVNLALRRFEDAEDVFRQVLAVDPNHVTARNAVERLSER